MKKKLLLSAFICAVCALNVSLYTKGEKIDTNTNSLIQAAYANSEQDGVDPGSCSSFSCTVTETSGPMRIWDPIAQEWYYGYVEGEVPGNYLDCENSGEANVCLCDPTCNAGAVGSA